MFTELWSLHRRQVVAFLIIFMLAASSAWSQEGFPDKPIRLIVPYAAGGSATITLNLIVDKVRQNTGKTLFLEYKPGASGNIGVEAVLKAPPDGYTIGFTALNSFAINPHLTKLPYDPQQDVQPITTIGSLPNLLVVNPDLKAKDLQELIALSKTTDLTYALTAIGSSIHLAAEMLMSESGLKMRAIPYKGDTAAMPDVLTGRVPVFMTSIPGLMGHVTSGRLRALAVTSGKRAEVLPDVPTVRESGVPGFDVHGNFVLFTARGVPAPALNWLHRELSKAIDSKDVRDGLAKVGIDAQSSTSAELQSLIKSEYARWGPVIKRLGIRWD